MTRYASLGSGRGLFGLCMLIASALVGCSAEPPSSAETEGIVTDELSWSGVCGGHTGHQCSSDKVCVSLFSRACPSPDTVGLCIRRPDHCPALSDPVCGCDGKTYANLCKAAAAGAAMTHQGACIPPPSCRAGATCPGAGTCSLDPKDCAGHVHDLFSRSLWEYDDRHDQAAVCECKATAACKTGERFNDSASVCACEPAGNGCSNVTCKAGEQCVARSDGTVACLPNACSGVTCKSGQVCVMHSDGTAACVADPCSGVSCKAGQTCVAQSDGTARCQ